MLDTLIIIVVVIIGVMAAPYMLLGFMMACVYALMLCMAIACTVAWVADLLRFGFISVVTSIKRLFK